MRIGFICPAFVCTLRELPSLWDRIGFMNELKKEGIEVYPWYFKICYGEDYTKCPFYRGAQEKIGVIKESFYKR